MDPDLAARARAWRHAAQAAVCDVIEPWAHGTVVRATRFPDYFDFNVVRVEEDPAMTAAELEAVADGALAGLGHRRLDFDDADVGERFRAELTERGYRAMRLLYMHHAGPPPGGRPAVAVEEVPYDDVRHLRVAWHQEDFPGQDPDAYLEQSREVAMRRGPQVLAVRGRSGDEIPGRGSSHELIAFAQLERPDAGAEITQVYVHPDHRGGGRGTAMTAAAIAAAGDAADLWIVADDEDRPKELYARLGFRPAWTALDFQKIL